MNFRYEFISKSSEIAMKRLKHFDFGDHVWCSPPYLCRLLHACREKETKKSSLLCSRRFFSYFIIRICPCLGLCLSWICLYNPWKNLYVCCSTYFQVNCDRELLLNFLFYWIWMPPDIGCWTFQKKYECENTNVKSTFNWIWMRLNIGQSWTFQNKYVPSQFTLFKETTSLL